MLNENANMHEVSRQMVELDMGNRTEQELATGLLRNRKIGSTNRILPPTPEIENKYLTFINGMIIINLLLNDNYNINKTYSHNYFGLELKEINNFLFIGENFEDNSIMSSIPNIEKIINYRIIKVNEKYVNTINDFKEAINNKISISIYTTQSDSEKDKIFRKDKPYPLTFFELLNSKNKYNNLSNNSELKAEQNRFLNILTRCQYKICRIEKKKILSSKLKSILNKKSLKRFSALIPEESTEKNNLAITSKNPLTIHSHIYVFDPVYNNTFTFDLLSNGKTCLISIPGIKDTCLVDESNWFNLNKKDLNLNINNDINYKSCNLKGELYNFLWKYIDYFELNYQTIESRKHYSFITEKLRNYLIINKKERQKKMKIDKNRIRIQEKINNLEKKTKQKDIDIENEIEKFKDNNKNDIVITLYLPYPEVKYSFFGLGLSSNYKKHINCQLFIKKMFGNQLIKRLTFKKYDMNIHNYRRLEGINHLVGNEAENINLNNNKFENKFKTRYFYNNEIKKEKLLREKFDRLVRSESNNINKMIINNDILTNNDRNILRKSINLHRSKKKDENFYNIIINLSKKELDSLLINPKLKKELSNKIKKKLKKKSKLQTLIKSIKSIKKSKRSRKYDNNRKTRIRKRIMISQLKKRFGNNNNVKKIDNNISIYELSDLYNKLFYGRIKQKPKKSKFMKFKWGKSKSNNNKPINSNQIDTNNYMGSYNLNENEV